jgi:hypothetical protein
MLMTMRVTGGAVNIIAGTGNRAVHGPIQRADLNDGQAQRAICAACEHWDGVCAGEFLAFSMEHPEIERPCVRWRQWIAGHRCPKGALQGV